VYKISIKNATIKPVLHVGESCMSAVTDIIEIDPEKMSGTPVFRGTRVPIQNLFDYLEGGDNIEVFLDDFPTVDREQVITVLELYKVKLLDEYEIAA